MFLLWLESGLILVSDFWIWIGFGYCWNFPDRIIKLKYPHSTGVE